MVSKLHVESVRQSAEVGPLHSPQACRPILVGLPLFCLRKLAFMEKQPGHLSAPVVERCSTAGLVEAVFVSRPAPTPHPTTARARPPPAEPSAVEQRAVVIPLPARGVREPLPPVDSEVEVSRLMVGIRRATEGCGHTTGIENPPPQSITHSEVETAPTM